MDGHTYNIPKDRQKVRFTDEQMDRQTYKWTDGKTIDGQVPVSWVSPSVWYIHISVMIDHLQYFPRAICYACQ